MTHHVHEDHKHVHGAGCGHTTIQHNDHEGALHGGHLHCEHEGHYDEHVIEVSDANPDGCQPVECQGGHSADKAEMVPHGDHTDYLVDGRLHHAHEGHCDDHGAVRITSK